MEMKASDPAKIVTQLVWAFRKREGVFCWRINVEDWVPEQLAGEQKAMFLFLITVLDYGMRSVVLYQGAQKLFADNPEFLKPKILLSFQKDKKRLSSILLEYLHIRFPNEATTRWLTNSALLLKRFGGKVLNIFQKRSALEVVDTIYLFRGFGKKTGHLFFRSVVNTFGFEYPDIDQVSMPIDRHKLRLTYQWGFISREDYQNKNRKKVAELWKAACRQAGISWLEFDRAFWVLGQASRFSSKLPGSSYL